MNKIRRPLAAQQPPAHSFSECTSIGVQSKSRITCSGAAPALHARSRAGARARLI